MKPLQSVPMLQWGYRMALLVLLLATSSTTAKAQTIALGEAVDNTSLTWTTGGDAEWFAQTLVYYYDGDGAQSGNVDGGQQSWIETTVTGPGILSFYWKVSSPFAWTDLEFHIDGIQKSVCWADSAWELDTYAIPSASHTLKWNFAPSLSGYAGYLDKVEYISGPAIIVKSPNGGETWYNRNFRTITWTGTEDVGTNVKIELLKGGSSVKTISTSTANDGRYHWFVPTAIIPGSDYRIRVSSATNASVYDDSNGNFSIIESLQPPLPSIFGGVLILDGVDDYAEAEDHSELDVGDEPDESFTIEAWVNFQDLWKEGIINKRNAYSLFVEQAYHDPPPATDCLGYSFQSASDQPCSVIHCHWPGDLSYGWHHVALMYDNPTGTVTAYFDGKNRCSGSCPSLKNSNETLRVGDGPWMGDELNGAIDEIRISAVVRYSGDFSPPTSLFTCDEHTRALWHFDEFEGATVFHDACGLVDNLLVGYNGAHTEGIPVYRLYLPFVTKQY